MEKEPPMLLSDLVVNTTKSNELEPRLTACRKCGDTKNVFVYGKVTNGQYTVGCCLCDNYADLAETAADAALKWNEQNGKNGK